MGLLLLPGAAEWPLLSDVSLFRAANFIPRPFLIVAQASCCALNGKCCHMASLAAVSVRRWGAEGARAAIERPLALWGLQVAHGPGHSDQLASVWPSQVFMRYIPPVLAILFLQGHRMSTSAHLRRTNTASTSPLLCGGPSSARCRVQRWTGSVSASVDHQLRPPAAGLGGGEVWEVLADSETSEQ